LALPGQEGKGRPASTSPAGSPRVNFNKPVLNPKTKIRTFAWKRIVLDKNGEPYKRDLSGLDPAYQGKAVVWKGLRESDKITLAMVESLFPDRKAGGGSQSPRRPGSVSPNRRPGSAAETIQSTVKAVKL